MTLIKSISGIRGTIGGHVGEGLNPLDIVKFTSAYATLIRKTTTVKSNKIVVGRDARISGEMVKNVVCGTLMGMGFDVVNIGLASTPTTELAVTMEGACGGIILTASHNPRQWNALKLLNEHGEFLNKEEGNEVLRIAEAEAFEFADIDHILQSVELFMVKHTDGIDGYLLCGNLPVCYGGFVHRSVTVRMNRTEIVIDRFRLFLAGIWCCPFVLNIIHHFADSICQNQVLLFDRLYQLYFFHTNII